MLRKSILVVFCALVLGPAWSALAGLDPSLAVYWPLDEGTGTIAHDMTINANNGTISAGPTWAPVGKIGGALNFTGTGDIRGAHVAMDQRSFTIAMWVNPTLPASGSQILFSEQSSGANSVSLHLRIGGPASTDSPVSGIRFGFYNDDLDSPANVVKSNTWYHLTFWYDWASKAKRIYINGVQIAAGTSTTGFLATSGVICLGSWYGGNYFTGMVDDFQIYQKALSDKEIQSIMAGLSNKSVAVNVSPEDGATDVTRDATLSWTAGQYPATHDVYLGTTLADVNNATRTNTTGILASKGQADTTFDPAGSLAYGQTYYWRIDEVNTSADGTIYKGGVWSFTAEPYGYPITSITATASSSAASMGPEKTIDGSGLTADLHGTEGTTMWLTGGAKPNWIQYQFDKVYKLFDLKVWNSNQLIEGFLGFGAKNVAIETSADGTTWTALANVPEFARATGMAGYAANTTVNMGGVMAKFVKLTINANWGGMAPQTGLSEVRFSYIPVQARTPQPATAATGIAVDPALNWRPGREAGSHQVFFGTDPNAVANGTASAKTVADHAFAPGSLNFGTTYYWQVSEVNTVTYPGDVWSFTTKEYAAVDDFETYDDADNRLYDAWIDGYTDGKSGSFVGYLSATNGTFGETTVIHGGKQSMPFEYNNVKAPYYSEATRTFDTTQNWTTNGADTLALYFQGRAVGFVDNGNNAFTMSASGTDIWNSADEFRFAYKSLNGNGSITMKVDSIGNTNVWAKAAVMIRETLDAGSKNTAIAVSAASGISFQWRDTTNAASANSGTGALVAPYWVRITRTGNVFKAEYSADGKTWIQQGVDTTVAMGTSVYLGLAVTSHDGTLTTVAEMSNVSTSGTVTGPWQALAIGVAMPTNGPAPLYLTVQDKTGKTKTVVNPNPSASATGAWTEWRIPLSSLTGVSLTTVQKITLGVGDKTSPKAGAAGMLYFDDIGYGHPVK
jgi:regulation of enolase protein 1 (concanavalin A-like superfamily)